MAIRIKAIEPASSAELAGILPGEKIVSINGHRIVNFLDLQFYGADEHIKIEIIRLNGETRYFDFPDNWDEPLGILPEDHKCRECANKCIFCFIDQMPPQQRDTLYIKDDDYAFSFVFGNFLTLTNLTERDYKKIFELRLSPLYISVHTTNPELHKQMLRYPQKFDIMTHLRLLQEHEIEFHTQIVLVPGYNDGEELENTLSDLNSLDEACLSIGIVPVGLTRFRKELDELRTVNSEEAAKALAISNKFERTWCSDEIYLKAGVEIPEEDFYEDYPQLENGIGMVRMFITNWQDSYMDFYKFLDELEEKLVFVCGELAESVIKELVDKINEDFPDKTRLQVIHNKFMGETVTVTGLITWQDIEAQLNLTTDEIAVFASNTFNTEGYTLDGKHQNKVANLLGGKILIIDEQFSYWEMVEE